MWLITEVLWSWGSRQALFCSPACGPIRRCRNARTVQSASLAAGSSSSCSRSRWSHWCHVPAGSADASNPHTLHQFPCISPLIPEFGCVWPWCGDWDETVQFLAIAALFHSTPAFLCTFVQYLHALPQGASDLGYIERSCSWGPEYQWQETRHVVWVLKVRA